MSKLNAYNDGYCKGYDKGYHDGLKELNVIHCKNCIYAKKGCYCEYTDRYMGLDDFCSRGKAKD